jgi:hypothetical protein
MNLRGSICACLQLTIRGVMCCMLTDVTALTWRQDETGWVLLSGRRRMGRIVPDRKYPGLMWRPVLSGTGCATGAPMQRP